MADLIGDCLSVDPVEEFGVLFLELLVGRGLSSSPDDGFQGSGGVNLGGL